MNMIDGESETAVDDSNLARASEPLLLPPRSTATPAQRRRSAPTNPFARFTFLSRSKAESPPMHHEAFLAPDDPPSTTTTTTTATLRPVKGRKRKGSLRKTALLGPARAAKVEAPTETLHSHEEIASIDEAVHQALSAPHQHHPRRLSLVSEDSTTTSPPNPPACTDSTSPTISPTSQSYASTTDDDDLSMAGAPSSIISNTPTSYFNTAPPIPRRRSSHKPTPSPLSALPVISSTPTDPHSYSETSRWGWVLLCSTWVIFTVGMGSCLGVWSWAWDVGQTPYAPPELEDDPTLPIVGYYPALIILTAVMAWVWVVVAWVGMKYFKHAKIQGDDD